MSQIKLVKMTNRWLGLLIIILFMGIGFQIGESAESPCVQNSADGYACHQIDLVAQLPLNMLGGDSDQGIVASDLWGWSSPTSGKEYVLFGLVDGVSFIDVTNSAEPRYLGKLPAHSIGRSNYRDIQVYDHYAFIVADKPYTDHGMQIFDLTQLDQITTTTTFTETAHYDKIGSGHNIWITQETGYLYIFRSDTCSSSTHIVDIRDPLHPTFAGCLLTGSADSDAQCLVYHGPDLDYTGHELCFIGSETAVTVADVTDKAAPRILHRLSYPNLHFAHQVLLTNNSRHLLVSDMMDEMMHGANTSTIIFDITDIDAPTYSRTYSHATIAMDHNLYSPYPNLILMTNWRAGLRAIDISDFANWQEVGYFDTYSADDFPEMLSGTWGHYDWFKSGIIAVSDVDRGLFLFRLRFPTPRIYLPIVVNP